MAFTWIAKYRDNKYKTQNENLPFERIPRHNLWQISILAPTNKKIVTFEMKPGFITFYRRRALMSPGSGVLEVVHIIGYKPKTSDANVVAFVYESDWHVEIGDFKNSGERSSSFNEYKHAIETLPEELVEITWD